jgi:hypothetical protein
MGLYGYVLEGEIVVENDFSNAPVSAGNYFFLASRESRIEMKGTPFDIFETVKDLGPVLIDGVNDKNIPATEVLNSRALPPQYQ